MNRLLPLIFILSSAGAFAQSDTTNVSSTDDLFDMSLEQLLQIDVVDKEFYLYGYINSNLQKTFSYPSLASDGSTQKQDDPYEWDPVKNFHIYGKGNVTSKISYLFNLAGNDDLVEIR